MIWIVRNVASSLGGESNSELRLGTDELEQFTGKERDSETVLDYFG